MIDIRDQVTSIFDLFDVSVESEKTVNDIEALCLELEDSQLAWLLNRSFLKMLGLACGSGWYKSGKPLGEYIEDCVLQESDNNEETIKLISQSSTCRNLLNSYGEAFLQGVEAPILVFKDKKTGKIIGHDTDLQPAIRPIVLSLLAAEFEEMLHPSEWNPLNSEMCDHDN